MLVLESGAALIENALYALPAGPSGQVDVADSAAGGQRRAPISVTTRANNVAKLAGSRSIIFTAFPFGTCTPEGTPHIPVERFNLYIHISRRLTPLYCLLAPIMEHRIAYAIGRRDESGRPAASPPSRTVAMHDLLVAYLFSAKKCVMFIDLYAVTLEPLAIAF